MPNIDDKLAAILEAKYGEAVRGSIHDAIEEINEVVENWEDGQMDTTLTSTTLPAQGKAAGDAIAVLRDTVSSLTGMSAGDGITWVEGEYIKTDNGEADTNANYKRSDYIEVPSGATLLVRCIDPVPYDNKYNAIYTENKTFIQSFNYTINGDKVLNLPTNAKYIRVSCRKSVLITVIPQYYYNVEEKIKNVEQNSIGLSNFKQDVMHNRFINMINFDGLFMNGYINGNTGEFVFGASGSGFNCCTDFIPVVGGSIFAFYNTASITYNVIQYNANKAFISGRFHTDAKSATTLNANTKYVRLSFKTSESGYNTGVAYEAYAISNILDQKMAWRNGSSANVNNTTAVTFEYIQPRLNAERITILIERPLPTGHKYRYQINTYSISTGTTNGNNNNRVTYDFTVVSDQNVCAFEFNDESVGFAIALYELDESDNYVALRITNVDTNDIHVIRHYATWPENYKNYSVASDFTRTPVTVKKLGTLSGKQAFCKYDGKYFSTNGSNLYEQDSSFALLSTTALSIGHGNSLQLGHNGKAYASGWDDQKIYEVDLTNKTVTATITLPTTGYTTAAIDDINGIAYIFQRDSYPSSEAVYNFIVYDYVNNNVISTKKLPHAFGAMQACDFVDGRIFVVNGTGTSATPNGYRIFNTNGDVIGEYVLNRFAGAEPEGVVVDRSNFAVQISYVDGSLYEVAKII